MPSTFGFLRKPKVLRLATAAVSRRLHLALRPHYVWHPLGLPACQSAGRQGLGSLCGKPPRYGIYFEMSSMKSFPASFWRFFCGLVLFLSVFWTPPVFAFLFGAVFLFFFPRFYEFLVAAFLLDILYGAPAPLWGGFQLVFYSAAIALFFLGGAVQKRMRF